MNVAFIGAIAALAAWIVLGFVVRVPSGWVHAFLAVGAVLVARGIVAWDRRRVERRERAGGP